jgi:hypothetical protein
VRIVWPRFFVSVLRIADSWPELSQKHVFAVRDRETKDRYNRPKIVFAGLGIKQAMATAAHHNRILWTPKATSRDMAGYTNLQENGWFPDE